MNCAVYYLLHTHQERVEHNISLYYITSFWPALHNSFKHTQTYTMINNKVRLYVMWSCIFKRTLAACIWLNNNTQIITILPQLYQYPTIKCERVGNFATLENFLKLHWQLHLFFFAVTTSKLHFFFCKKLHRFLQEFPKICFFKIKIPISCFFPIF